MFWINSQWGPHPQLSPHQLTSITISHGPLCQSEATCKAIDVKMIFNSHAHKTYFHKGFAINFVLKERVFELGKVLVDSIPEQQQLKPKTIFTSLESSSKESPTPTKSHNIVTWQCPGVTQLWMSVTGYRPIVLGGSNLWLAGKKVKLDCLGKLMTGPFLWQSYWLFWS